MLVFLNNYLQLQLSQISGKVLRKIINFTNKTGLTCLLGKQGRQKTAPSREMHFLVHVTVKFLQYLREYRNQGIFNK